LGFKASTVPELLIRTGFNFEQITVKILDEEQGSVALGDRVNPDTEFPASSEKVSARPYFDTGMFYCGRATRVPGGDKNFEMHAGARVGDDGQLGIHPKNRPCQSRGQRPGLSLFQAQQILVEAIGTVFAAAYQGRMFECGHTG
jgi:hypothetical protein